MTLSKLLPKGRKAWRSFLLRWIVILGLLISGVIYIIKMPDTTYSGPFQPLTDNERQYETERIPEVLKNQTQEILKYVKGTNNRLEFVKQFMDYLEYKEREIIIPQVEQILLKWDEVTSGIDKKLKVLSKKF